jgi:hypothetical protein
MSKFEIEIFRGKVGMWTPTAWGRNCKTREEAVAKAKECAAKPNKMNITRIRAVEILEEFTVDK